MHIRVCACASVCPETTGFYTMTAGAASGIGAACALEFAKLKCKLILTDIKSLQATCESCKNVGLIESQVNYRKY